MLLLFPDFFFISVLVPIQTSNFTCAELSTFAVSATETVEGSTFDSNVAFHICRITLNYYDSFRATGNIDSEQR